MKDLSEEILNLLDTSNSENKISIDVAIELTKLPDNVDKLEVLNKILTLTNIHKIEPIKQFNQNKHIDIDILDVIKDNLIIYHNNLPIVPSVPYVFDNANKKNILIPNNMFDEIVNLIKKMEK